MRLFNQLVFDEVVAGTTSVYTDPKWNTIFGAAEKLVIEAVVDNVTTASGSATITAFIEHSADNLHFQQKNGTGGSNPEVQITGMSAGSTYVKVGTDPTSASNPGIPSAAFARLNIALSVATTPQAHVKIWVTGRGEQGTTG